MPTDPLAPPGPLRPILILPDGPEYLIEPEAEARSETPGGLPLPAIVHEGRLVAGGATYRLCQARDLACPALELAADQDPAAALDGVIRLVESLAPGPRSLLMATRCQAGRGRPPRGAVTVSRQKAAERAGVQPADIAEALATLADPERLRRDWCLEPPAQAALAPPRHEPAEAVATPAEPDGRAKSPRAAGTEAPADRPVAARRPRGCGRTAAPVAPVGAGAVASTPEGGSHGAAEGRPTFAGAASESRSHCEAMVEQLKAAYRIALQALESNGQFLDVALELEAMNVKLMEQLSGVLKRLAMFGRALPPPGDLRTDAELWRNRN